MRALIEDYEIPPMPDMAARGPDVTESWISIENIDSDHLAALTQALSNVISTELAEFTYAQIVDGLPTRESFAEFRSFYPAGDEHPAYRHQHLCDGALDIARQFRSELSPLALRFDPHVSLPLPFCSPCLGAFLLTLEDRSCKPFRMNQSHLDGSSCD